MEGNFEKVDITGSFRDIISRIARSSHSIAVLNDKVYLFGGEHQPRIPVDAQMYIYDMKEKVWTIVPETETTPQARVGATMAAAGEDVYLFGGRGGKEMAPLPADIYKFSISDLTWSKIEIASGTSPEARSFHAMSASETDLYVFGGCPIKGRLNDLHRFNFATRAWVQLTSAPVSPRGGAAIAYCKDMLFIHGGFDGEEHSELVIYDVSSDIWKTGRLTATENQNGIPAPRSVHALVPLSSNVDSSDGQVNLVCLFGEGHPSNTGHDGAGSFFQDGYIFSTDISQKKGILEVSCTRLNLTGDIPVPRGWFQAAPLSGDRVLLSGGLNSDNARLADLYILHVAY